MFHLIVFSIVNLSFFLSRFHFIASNSMDFVSEDLHLAVNPSCVIDVGCR